jgi:ABC-type nitrate/sulfonate/bicarbonate transport system substrate-binding protein
MTLRSKSILTVAAAVTLLVLIALYFLLPRNGGPGGTEPVTVAYSPFESGMLFYLACEKGFFAQQGIRLDPRRYDTGAGSLDGLVSGEADIAVGVSEFPMVIQTFRQAAIRVVGNMDKAKLIYLIGRRDRGIERVADLAGKRVGTTLGTVAEFHLGRFLEVNGLSMSDIRVVDVTAPGEWVGAVLNGDIDAICTAQPYAHMLKKALGANGQGWLAQGGQSLHGLIVASESWVAAEPEQLKGFLQALAEAEDYARRNPDEARAVLKKWLDQDETYMETAWSQNRFFLSLDQELIVMMEDEARWMIGNGLTPEQNVPNFLDYIHTDALRAVRPAAVTIVGR